MPIAETDISKEWKIMAKKESGSVLDANLVFVELTKRTDTRDSKALACIHGGIDKVTVERKGNTTIIKIVSPDSEPYLGPGGWKRPARKELYRRPAAATIDGPH